MDYCEWLKDVPFIRYVGPDATWNDCLSVYGSSVTTHHPLVPFQVAESGPAPKCGPAPDRDPFVYAGLPLVSLIAATETVVGHPVAATSFVCDGAAVEAKVLQTTADRFKLDFYPHMFTTALQLAGTTVESMVTLADPSTFYVHTTVTNCDDSPHEYAPWIFGRLKNMLRGCARLEQEADTIAVDFTEAGGGRVNRYLRLRPGFGIEGYNILEWSFRPTGFLRPGEGKPVWWNYRPIGYELLGPAQVLQPEEKLTFTCAVGLSYDEAEAIASLQCVQQPPGELESAARQWYNDYLSGMPEPPEELSPRERQYYYGSAWVIRHNQIRPTGKFENIHWLHGKGFLGYWGDNIWTPDDSQFILLQAKDTAPELGKGLVREICHRQSPEGAFTTMNSAGEGSSGHGPYLFAWCLLQFHDTVGDDSFIAEVYEPFCRFHRWMLDYWDHDGSGLISTPMPTQGGGYDNNPTGFQLCAPVALADTNSGMIMDALALARMARILNKTEDVEHWERRAAELRTRVVQHFFHEKSGLFFSRYCESGEFIQIKGLQCMFFPLWARVADQELARDTIERYLLNEDEFFTPAPFPDIARSEIYHNTGRHSGTTFLHWSLMGLVILAEYGYHQQAEEARRRIIDFVSRSKSFWQFWCADGGGFDFKDMGGEHRVPNTTWCSVYGSIVRREYQRFAELTNELFPPSW